MFELIARMHFDTLADAQDAYAQLEARAINASVRTTPGAESASYAEVRDENTDAITDQFHTDIFGIVRDGPQEAGMPEWKMPTGVQDAYPANDVFGDPTRVIHNGNVWLNSHGDNNTWEPGVFGWQDEGAV